MLPMSNKIQKLLWQDTQRSWQIRWTSVSATRRLSARILVFRSDNKMSRWICYFQLSGIELDISQGVPLSLSIWSHPASLSSSGLSSNASFRSKPFLLRVVSEPNAAPETNGVCSVQIDEETPEKSSDKTVTKDGRSAKGLITNSVTSPPLMATNQYLMISCSVVDIIGCF